jgi:hypothetical protein
LEHTKFATIYNRFLGKITDDMYLELTPEDTIRDLQNLLIDAIPGFEFPRIDLQNYILDVVEIDEDKVEKDDFILGVVWNDSLTEEENEKVPKVLVERSRFNVELSNEEMHIIAVYMVVCWFDQQLASVEVTRMKYTGSDFKMTSQANHMAKLKTLRTEYERIGFHLQRLYKRRKSFNGIIKSTFGEIMSTSVRKDNDGDNISIIRDCGEEWQYLPDLPYA